MPGCERAAPRRALSMELKVQHVEVEAFEHLTHPEGGHAVIVLRGAPPLADDASFRLKPLGPGHDADTTPADLDRDFHPVSTTVTAGGVVLLVGPDVTGNPQLFPGELVEIVVPSAGLRGHFHWPAIIPQARTLRPNRPARPATPAAKTVMKSPAPSGAAERGSQTGPVRHPSPATIIAATALTLLGLQTLGMVVFDMKIIHSDEHAQPIALQQMVPPGGLDDMSTAITSPRGVSAQGMSPPKALERAYASLGSADGQRDPDEAEFWLKRYLATTFDTQSTRVVLTQLGSLYAETAKQPADFGKARLAWDLASTLGDPVAMCFLGAVYSQGWGVAPDSRIASEWYKRAAAAGGTCQTAGRSVMPMSR